MIDYLLLSVNAGHDQRELVPLLFPPGLQRLTLQLRLLLVQLSLSLLVLRGTNGLRNTTVWRQKDTTGQETNGYRQRSTTVKANPWHVTATYRLDSTQVRNLLDKRLLVTQGQRGRALAQLQRPDTGVRHVTTQFRKFRNERRTAICSQRNHLRVAPRHDNETEMHDHDHETAPAANRAGGATQPPWRHTRHSLDGNVHLRLRLVPRTERLGTARTRGTSARTRRILKTPRRKVRGDNQRHTLRSCWPSSLVVGRPHTKKWNPPGHPRSSARQ